VTDQPNPITVKAGVTPVVMSESTKVAAYRI
jgi:hypothetical protein